VPRTVRKGHADRPARSHGPSVKSNRTTRTDPRKTDRPRRPGEPSARVPDRPLLKLGPSANRLQRKPKKIGSNGNKPRTRRTPRRTRTSRTIRRQLADCPRRTELKPARPRRSTPPIHHRISQMVEAVETKVWGHDMRQPRKLYRKNYVS
jgi:hypothetical protein